MIKMEPVPLNGGVAVGVMVELPQTRQLTISTTKGYISAGYIDLPFLQQRRPERNIIAARVLDGVRSPICSPHACSTAHRPPRRWALCRE
jgi:uncharacterized protein YunC (DUF1805 family)